MSKRRTQDSPGPTAQPSTSKRPKVSSYLYYPVRTLANISYQLEETPPASALRSSTDKAAINLAFNNFANSLATLLSLPDDTLAWALPDEKTDFIRALTSLKSEMTWLPAQPPPLHPPPLTPARPTGATSKYPPSIPPLETADLRLQAFTHRSFIPGELANHSHNSHYERLEFLGDAFIQSLSSALLYSRFPEEREGALSQMRQTLVSNQTLAEYAQLYNFPSHLRIGKNVSDMVKPETRTKTLADMFEAYVGALIVEKGMERGVAVVKAWLETLWEPKVKDWESKRGMLEKVDKNAKQQLQVAVGGNLAKLNYKWSEGAGGNKGGYWVEVRMTGWGRKDEVLGKGWGQNKRHTLSTIVMNRDWNANLVIVMLNSVRQ